MKRATLKQTKSSINTANYTVQEHGLEIFEVHSNYIGNNMIVPVRITNGRETYSLHRKIPSGFHRIEQCDTMDLYSGDEKIGSVWQNRVFIYGTVTYTVQWRERCFTVYHVALGKKGFKLPIYEHGTQVALVEKGNVVLDLLDQYELYTGEDDLLPMVMLFACFYDRTEHSHSGKVVSSSKEYSWALSLNSKEREQYREEWVTPFLTQEEITKRAKIVLKIPFSQKFMMLLSFLPVILLTMVLCYVVLFVPSKRFILIPVCIWILMDIYSRHRRKKEQQ